MSMQRIRVAGDRWNFELADGTAFTPFGANVLNDMHPGQGNLFQDFDAADVERRFAAMEAVGLNVLRQPIGVNEVYDPKRGLKARGMRNWRRFAELAERHGVWLMPVGGYLGSNDWFDAEQLADDGRPLEDSCAFWAAFCREFVDFPGIFAWDIRNELLYDVKEHMVVGSGDASKAAASLVAGWPTYLEALYGTVDELNRHAGAWGRFDSFAQVPCSVRFREAPGDRLAYDFRNYLNEKGFRWSKRQVDVIRAAAPAHLVCSGNNGWLFPDMELWLANGFHNRAHHELYDFISVHPYPAPQCQPGGHGDPLNGGEALAFWLDAVVAMARLDHYHKPVMLQEFGWYGGGESRFLGPLPYRSEEEHARYTQTLIEHLLPHANGFVNWPLCDMPAANDISNHGGILTADAKPKKLAAVYRRLVRRHGGRARPRRAATTTITCSLLHLYTSRKYQDALWDDVHQLSRRGEVPDFRFI